MSLSLYLFTLLIHLSHLSLSQADEKREHVEVCPEGGIVVQQLANRIAEQGGAALIADYGHDGTKTDTFRVRASNFFFFRRARKACVLSMVNVV